MDFNRWVPGEDPATIKLLTGPMESDTMLEVFWKPVADDLPLDSIDGSYEVHIFQRTGLTIRTLQLPWHP